MNTVIYSIIFILAFFSLGVGLLMTLTINSWEKPCNDNHI